jgi:hypothetical protein
MLRYSARMRDRRKVTAFVGLLFFWASVSAVAQELQSVTVEELVRQDPIESEPTLDPVPQPTQGDTIDRELQLQRAIAHSLKGDHHKALQSLDGRANDTATLYARAVWLMENGDVREGVRLLEQISRRGDAPETTDKLLATGYLHLGQPSKAEASADVYLSNHQDDAYASYVRGLAILQQEEPERGRTALYQAGFDDVDVDQIQQVIMQSPVDVQQLRSTIAPTLSNARWSGARNLPDDKYYNFTLLFAGVYDSNVRLQPEFTGLGAIDDLDDFRFTMASFLDLQLLTCDDFNIGLVTSTFNTFQIDVNEFNIQDYMGGMYTNRLLKPDLMGSFRYEYHHTRVDSSSFANDHRLTPSLSWLGSRGHTTLFYEFNPIDADAPALIPAQDQSADIHRIGLTQAIYTFGGEGRIYAGYQYANANAVGSDFDCSTNMVTGRIERPLPRRWIIDLDVRYVWDNYDNPNSLDFFDRPRDDNRIEVRTGLQKNFLRPVSLRFDYTYIDNDSNTENLFGVRFYDYDRHTFSTQLIFSL